MAAHIVTFESYKNQETNLLSLLTNNFINRQKIGSIRS